jgi:hypothetical protein
MANPYKNTNRAGTSPFNQTDRLTEIQNMKDRLNKKIPYNSTTPLADENIISYEIPKGEMIGSAGALEWIGPGGALKIGRGILNVGKNLWNMGRKGGYGYSKPIATGKSYTQTGKVTYKNWGGKQHEFKELQNLRVTQQDIKTAKKLTKPYKIAGTVGRTGVYGAGISGIINYGDSGNKEITENVTAKDNIIFNPNKTFTDDINKRNQPFEMPQEDEKNK